ncbi:urate hydroxylase PuuD [Methylotetracoccus oryzae]|uniref:urate hydroxylase PuuD n=1 Tax=Methylotetracoccus oryzae TaxID=1919059 RepID=UPI0019148A9B|nr:urate hydroxylase PuuD [Methylotetracoccus oryzae]
MRNVMLILINSLGKAGLDKLERALMFGAGILVILAFVTGSFQMSREWLTFLFRWLHVLSGVMWIGLLWYFNFVQIPSMPKIPDEQKPAIGKVIAPTALFWFRWAALATLVTGLILAALNEYILEAMLLGYFKGGKATFIGVGMWLGLVMAYNVWMIIWPNQQKALGMVAASDDEKKAAARTAMLTSRFNTMLSIPMLYFMVAAQNLG